MGNKPGEFAKMTQKHLPKKASFVSLGCMQSSVYTKVLEFTLHVNTTLGDFVVSAIMFTFQCTVNNGVRKQDIFNLHLNLC